MSDLFDFKPQSRRYAVMGNPVAHSRSPLIHKLFGEQTGISLDYSRIQVDPGGFEQAVSHFAAHGGAGLNITVPFKLRAWQLCMRSGHSLSARAHIAEAVNTLKFSDDSICGDNTDGDGLVRDLTDNLGITLARKSVLLIGAGGAARGVIDPLLEQNPKRLIVANRTACKAKELASIFDRRCQGCSLHSIPDGHYDVIINATSSSLQGKLPDIDSACVTADTSVYDMMYAQQPTIFMTWALNLGAQSASDGLGMLVEQAAAAFEFWHNRKPDTLPVIEALRKPGKL